MVEALSVYCDGAANGARVSAELTLEHVPGDHDSLFFAWAEQAAERGSGAGQAPEVAAGKHGRHRKRGAAGCNRALLETVARHPIVGTGRSTPNRGVGQHDHVPVDVGVVLAEPDQPFGMRIFEGPQQHGVDDAEDGGIEADADRQRQHGDGGESGRAPQDAECEQQVLPELVDPGAAPDLAGLLLDQPDVAEFAQRGRPGVGWRHPALDVVLRLALQVLADVLFEIRKSALAACHTEPSPAGFRTLAMARASFSHRVVSTWSCRRPLALSR